MGIIDFRLRPLVSGYENMVGNGTIDKFLSAFRCEKTPSMRQRSVDLLLKEMDESGVELAVLPGRQSPKTFVPNADLMELYKSHPDRFEVFPLYNPNFPGESLEEIKALVLHGPCRGVSIEPGFGNSCVFDSPEYTPLYELLNSYSLPLMATFSGSITPVLDMTLPEKFHSVARQYPNITMIAGHGGWPWFRELCCMAFFTPNIYLVPDLYSTRCPGENDVRLAAEYMLRDRILFGSSYPLMPIGDAVRNIRAWGLPDDSEKAFFEINARYVLKKDLQNDRFIR